jgi:hypothetical protein
MRLPPKDDPGGDSEGRLPLREVLAVLRHHGVSVEQDAPDQDGDHCCTLIDDAAAEVCYLPDPVGGLMVKTLARKFGIPTVEFYYFRQLEAQRSAPPRH